MSFTDQLKGFLRKLARKPYSPSPTSSMPHTAPINTQITLHLYPDDYNLTRLGVLESGDQFIIDFNLIFNDGQTRDFVCTYRFWANGALKNYIIDEVGVRGEYEDDVFQTIIDKHIRDIGEFTISPIRFQPFSIQHSGTTSGYVTRKKEPDASAEDDDCVDVLPGHTLMFRPPWEEGAYAS